MSNELKNTVLLNDISTEDMGHHLDMAVQTKVPCIFWGAAGIGKTQIVEQYTKDRKYHFIDYLLVIRESVDVHGVPDTAIIGDSKRTVWAIPEEIPLEGDSKYDNTIIIFFLDELTTAAPETQAAVLKLVNERKIDNQPLHHNVRFVAAANPKSTKSHYNELLPPLKNRFKHYNVGADKEAWVEHAMLQGMNPAVIGFISQGSCSMEHFHIDHAKSGAYKAALEANAFPTGRSWEFFSEELTLLESMYTKGTKEFQKYLGQAVYGTVGKAAGSMFLSFYELAVAMPTTDEICRGVYNEEIIRSYKQEQRYFITTALAMHLKQLSMTTKAGLASKGLSEQGYKKEQQWVDSVHNATKFMMLVDGEMLTTFMCSFFKLYNLQYDFQSNSEITKLLQENEELSMYLQGLNL